MLSSIVSGLLICLIIIYYAVKFERSKFTFTKNTVLAVFASFISVYVAVSFIVTGVFAGMVHFNHILYVINIGIVLAFLYVVKNPFPKELNSDLKSRHLHVLALVLVVIVLLAYVLVNIHGELGGSHNRFD